MIQVDEDQNFITIFSEEEILGSYPKALWKKREFLEQAKKWIHLDRDEIKKALLDLEKEKAEKKAFFLLRSRSLHSKRLGSLLEEKGFSSIASKKAVEKCEVLGFLDDALYLKSCIHQGIQRRQSPKYLLAKLLKKQIPFGEIRAALDLWYGEKERLDVIESLRKVSKKEGASFSAYLYRKGF